MDELNEKYLEYAEMLSSITNLDRELYNKKKLLNDIKKELHGPEGDGGLGVEMSAHAFKQIAERLEILAMENPTIYQDVFKPDNPQDSLLLASNMKSFIITSIANARSKNLYKKENSKNSGFEFRYTIEIKRWSNEKALEFVAIVENNNIKTGYFNWV